MQSEATTKKSLFFCKHKTFRGSALYVCIAESSNNKKKENKPLRQFEKLNSKDVNGIAIIITTTKTMRVFIFASLCVSLSPSVSYDHIHRLLFQQSKKKNIISSNNNNKNILK